MTSSLKSFLRSHFSQGIRFVLVGGIGSTIDLGTLRLMVAYGGFSEHIAQVISTLLAVTFVFLANKFFTFKSRKSEVAGEAVRFAFVYGIAIVVNIATTSLLIWSGIHYLLAKMMAIGIGVIWNYLMSHYFVFRHKAPIEVEAF